MGSNTALGNGTYPTLSVTGASTIRDRSHTGGASTAVTVPNNITMNAALTITGMDGLGGSSTTGEAINFSGTVTMNNQTLTISTRT